jgi:ribosomal protein S18 acetylase RimI-like enzyme
MTESYKPNVSYVGALEQLPRSHINEAAAMAAAALLNSPSFAYMFEELDDTQRLAALTWLFAQTIKLRFETGSPRCAFYRQPGQPPEIACFFMLQPPNVSDISNWDLITHGMLLFPFKYGFTAFRRLLELMEYHDKDSKSFFESRASVGDFTEFCSLERMAVKPSFQGCGIGSACLKTALNEAEMKGYGVLLSTQEDINVKFYSRLGFSVIERKDYFNTKNRFGNATTTMARGLNLSPEKKKSGVITSNSKEDKFSSSDSMQKKSCSCVTYGSIAVAVLTCFVIGSKRGYFKY